MQTFIIFLLIFFGILIALFPIIRIVYFLTSNKTVQNKIVNVLIMIIIYLIMYFCVKNNIDKIISSGLGQRIEIGKNIVIIALTIIFGAIIESIINTALNFFVKRRMKSREK